MDGLMVVDAEGTVTRPWPFLDGLRCYDVQVDPQGRIWVTSAKGVYFTDGTTWTLLDERDGLPENTVNRVAFAPGGAVWLGGFGLAKGGVRPPCWFSPP